MELIEDSPESLVYQTKRNSLILKRTGIPANYSEYALTYVFVAVVVVSTLCIYSYLPYPFNISAIGLMVGICTVLVWQQVRLNYKFSERRRTVTIKKAQQTMHIYRIYGSSRIDDDVWRIKNILLITCTQDDMTDKKSGYCVQIITTHDIYFSATLAIFKDMAQAQKMKQHLIEALGHTCRLAFVCADDGTTAKAVSIIQNLDMPYAFIGQDMSHLNGRYAIYRGRKTTPQQYCQLYDMLRQQTIYLINTPEMIDSWAAYQTTKKLKRPAHGCLVFKGEYWNLEKLAPAQDSAISKTEVQRLVATIPDGFCYVEFAHDENGTWHISSIVDAQTHTMRHNFTLDYVHLYRRIARLID